MKAPTFIAFLFLSIALLPSMATAADDDEKILFLLSGQSNMQGMNPELTFVPRVVEEYGEDKVLVVKEAIGGRPIRMWVHDWSPAEDWKAASGVPAPKPEENARIYQSMMQKVEAATEGARLKAVAFCWMQGEKDAREGHAAVYERSLKTLFAQLQEEFPGVPMVFVIGQLSDFGKDNRQSAYPEWEEVSAALEKVADDLPNASLIQTADLNDGESPVNRKTGATRILKDDLHMSAEGYRVMGTRFAEESIRLLGEALATP